MRPLPPVIKWFGSKRPVAELLSQYIICSPKYFEPFLGGGAMLPFAKSKEMIVGDIIPELIELWNAIKDKPALVAEEYRNRWLRLQKEGPQVYYEIRDRFNKTKNCMDFLFITRTCVNGMIRYNSEGEFNNSLHVSRPGINPDTLQSIVLRWSQILQNCQILNLDYRETLRTVSKGDFVFLDPPYGGTKDRYTHVKFNLSDFYCELARLNSIGAYWMLTFDGSSGERIYNFAPPSELYKEKFSVNTGCSAFSKLIEKKHDVIRESVYLNFKPFHSAKSLFDEIFDEPTFSIEKQM